MREILLVIALVIVHAGGAAGKQPGVDPSIPPDKASILLYSEAPDADNVYDLSDGFGVSLDTGTISTGVPFAKRYLLNPGDYELHVTGVTPIPLKVIPGETTYVRIAAPRPGAAIVGGSEKAKAEEIIRWLKERDGSQMTVPLPIEPNDREIHLSIRGPGVRPPPPPPKE